MTEHDAMREAGRADILRAFGLKPWDIGLAPVPRRIRIWRKITLAKWRARRAAPAPCDQCEDGLVAIGRCNCGSPADASIGYAHERLCGFEPCSNGCWDRRETAFAERAHWQRLGLLMDLNEAFPLPDGMYFDIDDEG